MIICDTCRTQAERKTLPIQMSSACDLEGMQAQAEHHDGLPEDGLADRMQAWWMAHLTAAWLQ